MSFLSLIFDPGPIAMFTGGVFGPKRLYSSLAMPPFWRWGCCSVFCFFLAGWLASSRWMLSTSKISFADMMDGGLDGVGTG